MDVAPNCSCSQSQAMNPGCPERSTRLVREQHVEARRQGASLDVLHHHAHVHGHRVPASHPGEVATHDGPNSVS